MLTSSSRIRLWIAAALCCMAVLLAVFSHLAGKADSQAMRRPAATGVARAQVEGVVRVVEAVAARFSIPRTAMRTISGRKGNAVPAEVRLRVGPEFSSYEFQSALSAALSDLDVDVTGTENLRTKTTTMDVAQTETTLVRVSLDMRPLPQQPRKESSH